MEILRWHRLDNSAKIYPLLQKKDHQNLFRLTAEMVETVEADVLERALRNIMPRFPSFNVSLRKGIFWHYLEKLDGEPTVYPDSDIVLSNISTVGTMGYNFRVAYYENRIAVDFFHAICDGYGGLEFLKSLVYEYLVLQGHEIDSEEKLILPSSKVLKEESVDSFKTYAQKVGITKIKGVDELRGKNAFLIDDFRFDYAGSGIIQGEINTAELLAKARSYGVTMTAYIGAQVAYAIYKAKRLAPNGNRPIMLFIPINLRKMFPSKTLLNFSLFSRCDVDINGDEITFLDILKRTQTALKRDIDKNKLQNQINTTVKAESIFLFRLFPLPLKQLVFKISGLFFGKAKKTITLSNLGPVNLPEDMRPFVKKFTAILTTNKTAPYALTMCSTFDVTVINFTRKIMDTEIEKQFFRALAADGLKVNVCSNYWEAEDVL